MQTTHRVHSAPNRNMSSQGTSSKFTLASLDHCAHKLVAEFIGTFVLTWMHAGLALSLKNTAVESAAFPDQRTTISVYAIGAGLSVAGLVYGLGHISGAHLNPSISLTFFLQGGMHLGWLLSFVIVQVAGGFAAAGILDAVFINDAAHGNLGANQPSAGLSVLAAFWMEFIGSMFLQLAIVGTASRKHVTAGDIALAAGLTIGALLALLSPYGGGSMNPVRSIGPGVLAASPSARESTWIYVVAPLGAAVVTGITLRWLAQKLDDKNENDEPHLCCHCSHAYEKPTPQDNNRNSNDKIQPLDAGMSCFCWNQSDSLLFC